LFFFRSFTDIIMLSNNNHKEPPLLAGEKRSRPSSYDREYNMTANSEISALLRELGLTEIESEAYLALLQASRGEPVSGYRVAKDMGRDPANLAKTLAALGRQGAVRVVQEKPRLFLPVSPDEFTGQVLQRMAETQQRAVQLLREFESTPAAGTALALAGPDQVMERARLMLGGCRAEAQIFASDAVCESLSAQIDELVINRNCRLRIISTRAMAFPGAECVSLALPAGVQDSDSTPWLQLVVDREVWLVAQLRTDGTTQAPSGWWGEDSGLGLVLAASLNAMNAEAVAIPAPIPHGEPETEPAVEFTPVPEPVEASIPEPEPEPEPAPEPEPEPEKEVESNHEAVPEPAPTPAPDEVEKESEDDDEDDDGFQFILRHEEEN
jgi:sugar-specific transcriptional regulator TrmB